MSVKMTMETVTLCVRQNRRQRKQEEERRKNALIYRQDEGGIHKKRNILELYKMHWKCYRKKQEKIWRRNVVKLKSRRKDRIIKKRNRRSKEALELRMIRKRRCRKSRSRRTHDVHGRLERVMISLFCWFCLSLSCREEGNEQGGGARE